MAGVRRGGGRTAADDAMTQKLYDEGRCFTCGETGHQQRPSARSRSQQQGKGKAE